VSVLFTGTEASVRALETAISLVPGPQKELNVLLSAEDEAEMSRLQELAAKQLGDEINNAYFIRLSDGSLSDLLEILSDTNSSVLIIERDHKILQVPSLKRSLCELNCPLIIVR
jgi:hypothetical protein